MNNPHRLAPDAPRGFGGIALDRSAKLSFRLNGRTIEGYGGDTVLTALLASGVTSIGRFADSPLALSDRLAPLVAGKGGEFLPSDRLPARDGLELTTPGYRPTLLRRGGLLDGTVDGIPEPPWLRSKPERTVAADLLVVGGGVAGLAAAEAAASAGSTVVLVERRPWLGGDARYFGPVGDEPSPDAVTTDLLARLGALPNVTTFTHAEVFALAGTLAHFHHISDGRGAVVAVNARRLVLATGSTQRLPVFTGNRLPGVVSAMSAYHLAKRYGVAIGRSAIVATGSNYGYRLALRFHDAGVRIERIVDTRVNPQSRFVDFAKASGLKLAGGQLPLSASLDRAGKLEVTLADMGSTPGSAPLATESLIVSGPFQPDLTLWLQAGGATQWSNGKLVAYGAVEDVAVAGAAANFRSLKACLASGRDAVAALFGRERIAVEDTEIGAPYETPEVPVSIAPPTAGAPAFLDGGLSLIVRADPRRKPVLVRHAQAPSLGDIAASVELGLTLPADAGALAEERGAPGGDLPASDWSPPARTATGTPAWLTARFGNSEPVHLVVDGKRRFARGALVYANTSAPDPMLAVGVIVAEAPPGDAGGQALITSAALLVTDRFIVETLDGPSPARIAKR